MPSDDEKGLSDPPAAQGTHQFRRQKTGEAVLPPALAIAVAIALYALLPESLLIKPRFLIPSIEAALLVAILSTNRRRLTRQTRWSRYVSLGLALIVMLTNLVALVLLIHD